MASHHERPPRASCASPQPKTKPMSPEQLVAEVRGIYAGLVMIEGKCIEVDNAQTRQKYNDLNSEQWTALITLHRTLLHEHHDFFLASQHPSANIALRRLPSEDGMPARIWRHGVHGSPEARVPSKYATPARMWRHGIHSFLEVLGHRLPHAGDQLSDFVHTAYGMMAAVHDTVPAFEVNLTPDKHPNTARLHHRPAVIRRPRTSRGQSDRGNPPQRPPDSPHQLSGDFSWSINHPDAEMLLTDHWYINQNCVEEGEKQFEVPSMRDRREERERWLGRRLATPSSWWRWKWKLKPCHLTQLCHTAAGFFATLPTVAAQPVEREKSDAGDPSDNPAHHYAQFLNWALPPTFLLMLAYVELAGRYYEQRRKWYIIAMVLSNLSFPWLVEHDGISPMFTVCVFAFALRPAWAYAMMDYDELRPSPAFYTIMAIGGFGIAAMIAALSQNGSIPGANTSSGGNPFSVYLLFGMTASMILCGRGLAACREWINSHALPRSLV